MNRKYQLGTEENRDFLKRIREGLFRFGEKYASPQAVPIIWEMTVRLGRTGRVKLG